MSVSIRPSGSTAPKTPRKSCRPSTGPTNGLAQRTSDISSAKTEATPAVQVPQAKQEKASPSDGKKKEKPPLGKYLLIAGVVGFVLLLLMAVVAFLLWKFVINPG